jgi:hypothetical protein
VFIKIPEENQSHPNDLKFCHRISGHRSLIFNRSISIEDTEVAQKNLVGDIASINNKWNGKPTGGLQADFDKVLIALISDEVNSSLVFKQGDEQQTKPATKLDLVVKLWNELLPTRKIKVSGTSVIITSLDSEYKLDQCSEGEKSIFYILGQCVNAPNNSLIIIDEPEIHINKSILPTLFDKIESIRNDCAFLYITHDIDFSKSRSNSDCYIIKNYTHPNKWEARKSNSPENIPNDVIARIAGSRKPILFCEGDENSLDNFYKKVYPNFTVIPVKSCRDVINITTSLNNNEITGFHNLSCNGVIDGDNQDRDTESVKQIKTGLLENIFLIPDIAKILYRILHEEWPGDQDYVDLVLSWSKQNTEWRRKNIVDISRNAIESIISNPPHDKSQFIKWVDSIDLSAVKKSIESENSLWEECLEKANSGDVLPLLKIHRGKGLVTHLARQLKIKGKNELFKKLTQSDDADLINSLRKHLPQFSVSG